MQFDTPSKAFEGLSSPSKMFQESPLRNQSTKFADFLNVSLDPNDWTSGAMMDQLDFTRPNAGGITDMPELDIFKGFDKIGSTSQNNSRNPPRSNKPGLPRSYTTQF